jgi:hypothetical protein
MKTHPTYELLEEIGRGSAATVFRAYDTALKRNVAIKELNAKFQGDERQMEQFWEEAQFLANLKHDNIVQIHGLDKERGWIIMELMKGSLDAKVAEGPLPPDLVRSVLRQTLSALQALHASKKFHGGVRPGNLLINDKGRVKLSDSAGIALTEEIRRPTGSSKYLAPEMLNPEFGQVGTQVDLYSLGLSALEMLKGPSFDRLFKGVSGGATEPELAWMRWHSSAAEALAPLKELIPDVPGDLAAVIDKLLKKHVAERYATAADALRDLEDRPLVLVEPARSTAAKPPVAGTGKGGVQAVGGFLPKPPPPKPVPPKEPTKKPIDARKVAIYGGIAAGVVLVVVLLLAVSFGGDKPVDVEIVTTAPGASVRINGKDQQKKTPAVFRLEGGDNKVVLSLAGQPDRKLLIKVKSDKVGAFDPADTAKPQASVDVADGKGKGPLTIAYGPPPGKDPAKSDGGPKPGDKDAITLKIASNPTGAAIYVNKKKQDKVTDAVLVFAVQVGEKSKVSVMVELEGYDSQTEVVEMQAGQTWEKKFELRKPKAPRLGKLQLFTVPPGASVYIDDDEKPQPVKTKGKADLGPGDYYEVPTVPYKLKVVLDNLEYEDTIKPPAGKMQVLGFELVRDVTITSKPPGAVVYIDKLPKPLGKTDGVFSVPNTRPFHIRLVKDGYETKTEMVDPKRLEKGRLDYILDPLKKTGAREEDSPQRRKGSTEVRRSDFSFREPINRCPWTFVLPWCLCGESSYRSSP